MNMLRKLLAVTLTLFAFSVLPAVAAYNGVVHFGNGGAQVGQVIFQGAPAQSITGATTETILANVLIPAGMVGINDRVIIRTWWNFTGTAGTKTLKVYHNTTAAAGGTTYLSSAGASGDLSAFYESFFMNTGTAAAQIGGLTTGAVGRSTAAVLPAGTIDTSANSYIVITAQLANAADTATLAGIQIEVLKNN